MPSTNELNESQRETNFKERLDQVARDVRQPKEPEQANGQPSFLEKVTEYVPGAAKILGTGSQDKDKAEPAKQPEISGPPHRPDHDGHIEEFMRDQHRSKKPDGSLVG
ncbi:hypothetical protein F5Y15DRAFT_419195 [Xylariaceae sp. FL0016]|nr:hypothetical protein F5Y15DRAFT_419195 [Xylariaceae sp. FL0016]